MPTLAETYDVALLDLDGVVYVGRQAVDHAAETLRAARAQGMRLAFVTNNAARPPATVAEHLVELGVAATPEEVVTSAQAAARVLAERLPPGSPVLVVGGVGLEEALRERGLRPVARVEDAPVAVAQGFHPSVGWEQLAEGAYAVASGLLWVASNLDRTIPTARGIAPGNGTLVAAVEAATGRTPLVAGKPEPPMHREAVLRSGANRPLVVGDRLDTDIEGASRVGVDSLLVLTGVTRPLDAVLAPPQHRPTFLAADLRGLHASDDDVRVAAGVTERGRWSARLDGGRVHLVGRGDIGANATTGDQLDLLRAVCGAAWSAADGTPVDEQSVVRALDAAGSQGG